MSYPDGWRGNPADIEFNESADCAPELPIYATASHNGIEVHEVLAPAKIDGVYRFHPHTLAELDARFEKPSDLIEALASWCRYIDRAGPRFSVPFGAGGL